jgi:drug/metabolite transporter (DMT)-like permease
MPALLMLIASALFAVQGGLVKHGIATLGAVELLFFRSAIVALCAFAYLRARRLEMRSARPREQVALALAGSTSLLCYFISIGVLPLGTATALAYTAPIFLAVLLIAGGAKRPPLFALAAVLTGFAGVWLLLRPSVFGQEWLAVAVGLLSGALGGVAYLMISRLAAAGESEWLTTLYFSLGGCLLSGAALTVLGFSIRGWDELALVLAIGIIATFAQVAVTAAYAYGRPLIPPTLSYATVVFSSLIGVWLWSERLDFDAWLGIALVVVSGAIAVVRQASLGLPVAAGSDRKEAG